MNGPANYRKATRHYAHLSLCAKSRKLMMQSWKNDQKPQFRQFFDKFEAKYLETASFSEKQVSFKFKVLFSTIFRPKTKKIVFKKNISVWFWANFKTFLRISPNQELFSKIRPCNFSTFIVRKLRNQSTSQLLPTILMLYDLADAGPIN